MFATSAWTALFVQCILMFCVMQLARFLELSVYLWFIVLVLYFLVNAIDQ